MKSQFDLMKRSFLNSLHHGTEQDSGLVPSLYSSTLHFLMKQFKPKRSSIFCQKRFPSKLQLKCLTSDEICASFVLF
jgi:hypothetical protein